MGCMASKCCKENGEWHGIPDDYADDRPTMQMCAPGKDAVNFADVGDKVVLFVNFGPHCLPCKLVDDTIEHISALERTREAVANANTYRNSQHRYDFEVLIANQVTELVKLHPAQQDSQTYKAVAKIPLNNSSAQDGQPIPVRLPYLTTTNEQQNIYKEMTEKDIRNKHHTVFFQSLWSQLKDHNIQNSNSIASQSSLLQRTAGGAYGSFGETAHDRQDGQDATDSVERQEIAYARQGSANYQKAKRYWPDSWQMHCWGKCCDSILRSDKPIPKFIAQFFVAPLTNVTGLSLRYQLYLSEIFHTQFWTRLGHYLSMPLIVLMMLTFFAQFRFVFDNDVTNCYKTNNFEVLIVNGTLLLAIVFFIWYFLWGLIQKTCFMGIFMILPLIILVILANIYFQLAIKNTMIINHDTVTCNACWNHTIYANGFIHYYNIFHLMEWYFNPILWAGVLSMFQSLSHVFEPKIPPRVSQTAHWLSCSHMCKRMGYSKTLCVLSAQTLFGAVDEFLASPRLLPIFILRVCYELGYQPEEWKWMKKLVKMCIEYGDPALDYIGVGGANHPSTSSVVFNKNVSIDELKKEVRSMKHALTAPQRKILVEPALMQSYRKHGRNDPFLQHYVTLRHYVAQYALQVYAYGPFRIQYDENQAQIDNDRMDRDFGGNPSFLNFLYQVRLGLWKMEDDLLNRRNLSGCCEPAIEEVRVI